MKIKKEFVKDRIGLCMAETIIIVLFKVYSNISMQINLWYTECNRWYNLASYVFNNLFIISHSYCN